MQIAFVEPGIDEAGIEAKRGVIVGGDRRYRMSELLAEAASSSPEAAA